MGDSGVGFYKVSTANDILVSPFRCWLTADESGSSAHFMSILFDNTTTAIHPVDDGQLMMDNDIYNLQGRKYSAGDTLRPGIYIKKGKKLVVK